MVLGEEIVALVDVTCHGDVPHRIGVRRAAQDRMERDPIDEVLVDHVPAGVQPHERGPVAILDADNLGEVCRALFREELTGLGPDEDVERPQVLREDGRPGIEVQGPIARPEGDAVARRCPRGRARGRARPRQVRQSSGGDGEPAGSITRPRVTAALTSTIGQPASMSIRVAAPTRRIVSSTTGSASVR